jgi:hypothetical protein
MDLFARAEEEADRYEADVAGGGKRVRRRAVAAEHVHLAEGPDGALRLTCEARAYHGEAEHIADCPRVVFLEFVPAAAGLPEDWRGWAALELDCTGGEVATDVELTVLGARSRLIDRRHLEPSGRATLRVDLRDLALTAGIKPPYEPQAVRLAFFLDEGGPPGRCDLRRLALVGRRESVAVLDRWGQRISEEWPGKVRSDADLEAAREAETAALREMGRPAGRGTYGGWTGGEAFAATGFFRVQRDDGGRWWYVDPEGLPFWSLGPTCVGLGDATVLEGREECFADPAPAGPDFTRDEDGRVRFYGLNVYRKYGTVDAWAARARERLLAWGANTAANWSHPAVFGQGVAYVKTLSSRVGRAPLRFGRMPDVSDPAWEEALRAHFRAEAAPLAEDPWLIGYFVDNEMPWGCLEATEREAYAERYFSTVRRVLKEVDPNHLYLGCRFVRVMPDPVIPRVAGRYVDVLSVNAYSLVPRRVEFDAWHAEADRPIQIGEHQFALRDPRGLPTPWMALTADERREAVVGYSRAAAELPYCVGSHWFQFQDQPGTGRPSNGENMLIGLVDITDRPYPHMVDAMRTRGANVYAWHAETG